MKNEIGLVEFMEKYMTIKNADGSFSKPTEQMLEMARTIEKAQSEGYDLKLVRGRGSDRIAFVKKNLFCNPPLSNQSKCNKNL